MARAIRPDATASSGTTASWSRGATPSCTCCPTGCTMRAACSRASAPMAATIFKCTEHSERLKRSAEHPRLRDSLFGRRDRRRQAAGARAQRPAGRLCAAGRLARLRDDGRVGAEQHHPPRHRDLGMAELFRSGRSGSRASASTSPSIAGPIRRPRPASPRRPGLYMICTISKHKAERKGYADAMMLDWQGRVAECTGANIFFIKDGKIHTPIADCFLAGITRRDRDRARQAARHRGDRAAHHAGRARPASPSASSPAPPPR